METLIYKMYFNDNQYVKSYYSTDAIWKKYYNFILDTDCITIELDSPGTATLTVSRKGDWRCDLFYSFNMKTWTPFNDLHDTGAGDIDVTVEFTNKIYLKGDIYSGRTSSLAGASQYNTLKINKLHSISGNLMSLVDNDDIRPYMFNNLFYDNRNLTDASRLIFPALILDERCYNQMFYGCSSLVNAPELPATTLAYGCYALMFNNCSSLVNAPELPATVLAGECYLGMFQNCSSLTNAPELPATTLTTSCYQNMFYGCSSLTKSPILRAEILKPYCYSNMFYRCSSLNNVTILATDISARECLSNWLNVVSSTGTLKKINGVEYTTGGSGIPTGWTGTDIFYLVNRERQTDGSGRWAWHGYSNQENWVSTSWDDNLENENFLMYLDSNNYIRDMLNDAKMWSAWHTEHNFDDLKLYSATDTDSKQVFLPCGYGTYQGTYYRIFGANFNGNKTTANKYSMAEFINAWGYGRSSTYCVSYEKKFYRYEKQTYKIKNGRIYIAVENDSITENGCVTGYSINMTKPNNAVDEWNVEVDTVTNLLKIYTVNNGIRYYIYAEKNEEHTENSSAFIKLTTDVKKVNIYKINSNNSFFISNSLYNTSYINATASSGGNLFPCVNIAEWGGFYVAFNDYSSGDTGNLFTLEPAHGPEPTGPQLIDYQYFTNMAVNEQVEIALSGCYSYAQGGGGIAPALATIRTTGGNTYTSISGSTKDAQYNSILSNKNNYNTFVLTKKSSTTATIVPKYNTGWALQSGSSTWSTGTVTYDITFPEPVDKTNFYSWVNAVNNGDCIRIAVSNNKWNTGGTSTIKWATGTGGYSVWLAWKLN